MACMGYMTKVQVIKRANENRQFYFICPAPLAQALEMEQGEEIEWVVEDRNTLIIRRTAPKRSRKRGKSGR
jgi:bifunctional DNA-binding transcriptional regulator/antitoxin component of YhaV-PrlF toxin-antitoxin module